MLFHKTRELNHKSIKLVLHNKNCSITTESLRNKVISTGYKYTDTLRILLLLHKNGESGSQGCASDTQQPVFTMLGFF